MNSSPIVTQHSIFPGRAGASAAAMPSPWLSTLRRYIGFVAAANLIWEVLHLPLYTLWAKEEIKDLAFAAVHCTGGDVLIALSSLVLALFIVGDSRWPSDRFGPVVVLTILFGLAYMLFSEWLNVTVRQSWAYADGMPVLPILKVGLSPVLQWIAIPLAAFWWARRNHVLLRLTSHEVVR